MTSFEKNCESPQSEMKKSVDFDPECTLWSNLGVSEWKDSIESNDSIFTSLYIATNAKLLNAINSDGFDALIDLGCGCGQIVGELSNKTNIPCIGVDINEDFIKYCKEKYPKGKYDVLNFSDVDKWWADNNYSKFKKPMIICCNNTMGVIPLDLRRDIVNAMIDHAGVNGKCLITYWDGRYFPHALKAYYGKNPNLCGPFTIEDCVDFEKRHLESETGYCTTWLLAHEVVRIMQSLDVNDIYHLKKASKTLLKDNYVENVDIGIFVWLNGASKNTAKDYYDSVDVQEFYSSVWGERNIHIGRHDLLEGQSKCSKYDLMLQAQEKHENYLIDKIQSLMVSSSPFRIADLGCGYGSFLSNLVARGNGNVWKAYGFDISQEMINKCKTKTADEPNNPITWGVESYLCTSLGDESVDVVHSMDAFLHVGGKMHSKVLKEAWRVLRPGGYLIFNDIMQRSDAIPEELAPILANLKLSELGSVENYRKVGEKQGFRNFTYEDMSQCVPLHYEMCKSVLNEKAAANGGLSPRSNSFMETMNNNFTLWEKCSTRNLNWGVISMQKCGRACI